MSVLDLGGGAGWSMALGDSLAIMRELPDSSFDVTITDPPYEAEAHTKGKRQSKTRDGHKRVVDDGIDFAPITEEQRIEASKQIGRITRKIAVVFCQVEAVAAWRSTLNASGMAYRRTIPWVKPNAMPSLHGRWPGQAMEAIVIATRGTATAPVGGKARYYECNVERGGDHPTQKPLKLMRAIVEDFTHPGEIVLDPFAGSGTTGVACRLWGRGFHGIELERKYFEIACRRIAGKAAQIDIQADLFTKGATDALSATT